MKTNRLTHLLLLLSFGLASASAAQPHREGERPDPEERIERRVGFLDERLDLSDAQEVELRQALTAQLEEARAWTEAHPDATREERRGFLKEQRQEARTSVAALLTPEQRQELRQLRAEVGERRGDRRARRGDRAEKLAGKLDLTNAQKEQLQALRAERRADVQAWREAHPDATREEKRAFREERRDEAQAALEAILTPEQRQTLAEWKERRAERKERRRNRKGDRPSGDRKGSDARADEAPTSDFGLENYPNPFNPTTEIRFTLREAGPVRLVVYDVQGREVGRLVDEALEAGPHAVPFDASGLPTGTYLYRLTAGGLTEAGRMALVK